MIARPCFVFAFAAALTAPLTAQQRVALDGEWTLDGKPATVPGTFEDVLGKDFDGVATYRRALPLPERRPAHVRIEFAAVATHATVSVNGTKVGEHLGGWTPFRVDATAALKWDGTDVLEVRVDEKVGHNTQGFLPIVEPHFGGIWQGVTLCLDDGPVIDRFGLTLFGRWRPLAFNNPPALLDYEVPIVGDAAGTTIAVEVLGGTPAHGDGGTGTIELAGVEPWAPGAPNLYPVAVTLSRDGKVLDRVERRVGFRALAANGRKVLWNGEPLQVRGVLHWGYSAPAFAPPADPAHWRAQLTAFQAMGFNCVKCCLWVPPACFYDLCDELGMLVWQEYPTWHPQMDQAHKQELLTEYGEFFVHDRCHPSVAFRSITCETGHGADFDVVKALFLACKAAVPDTLVVDDSSWIGWQRITDFWDEHPYGNNSWFPGRLAEFDKYIAEKGSKPLLLGECIAADTWVDSAAFRQALGDERPWWLPSCWNAQEGAEAWLRARFGQATIDALLPASLGFAMRMRKFQLETLRLRSPDTGVVVSVARDIPKCRMGFYDDLGRPKWSAADWAWFGDTMLCLDLPWDGHSLRDGGTPIPVRIAHHGRGQLHGRLTLAVENGPSAGFDVDLAPGTVSEPFAIAVGGFAEKVTRVRVTARLAGTHPAQNQWDLWQMPTEHLPGIPGVQVVTALTPDLLAQIENGAAVLLCAGDDPGSVRTEGMWFLKGAPFTPPGHPLFGRLPAAMLQDLCAFDLESGRVMPLDGWRDEVDPILGFWETHDIDEVRFHAYAFETRIGKGRLLATTWKLDDDATEPRAVPGNAARFEVRYRLLDHLAHGPAPQHALAPATIAALRGKLAEKKLDLPTWRFRTDPQDKGRAAGWQDPKTDVTGSDWRDLKAGSHWENQAEDLKQYTGIAWYRVDFDIPADWQGLDARAVFEGVDDSFEAWLDGESVGRFGDPEKGITIWLERQVAELGRRLAPGRHTLTLRVVDHAGAGGLWKPVFLTTGPVGARSRLLH